RRSVPSPITCSCPTSSSRLRGRMRVERGARDESCCNRFASNMSIGASGVALFGVEVTGFLFELLEQVDQLLAGGHADLVHGLEHFFQLVDASEELLQVGRVTAVPSPGSVQVNDVVWHEERLLQLIPAKGRVPVPPELAGATYRSQLQGVAVRAAIPATGTRRAGRGQRRRASRHRQTRSCHGGAGRGAGTRPGGRPQSRRR